MWLLVTAARADDGPEPPERVRLSYALDADCPPPEQFEAELDARLGSSWRAAPDELARTVSISGSSRDGGHVVRLDYQDRTGRSITRTTTAATCGEALQQMALITAVAIDAQLPEPPPSAPSPLPGSTPTACPVCPVCEPAAPPPKPEPPPLVHEVGARLGVSTGFGPSASVGLGAEWGLVAPTGLEARVAVDAHNTGDTEASNARASFRAFLLRAEGCFATLALSRALGVPFCAGVEGGLLWVEGVLTPPALTFTRSSVVPVVAGVVAPRLRVASQSVYFEATPEVRIPFVGHTFWFESPRRKAYEIPDIALGVTLAAGARFR